MTSSEIHVRVDQGIRDVYRDLEAMSPGLEVVVTDALARGAGWIADASRKWVPVGPGPEAGAVNPNDLLPHVFQTITGEARGMTARVVSDHPAAPLIEFGGTIAPSVSGGTTVARVTHPTAIIRFAESAMVRKGAAEQIDRVEAEIERTLDALIHGLTL